MTWAEFIHDLTGHYGVTGKAIPVTRGYGKTARTEHLHCLVRKHDSGRVDEVPLYNFGDGNRVVATSVINTICDRLGITDYDPHK